MKYKPNGQEHYFLDLVSMKIVSSDDLTEKIGIITWINLSEKIVHSTKYLASNILDWRHIQF